MNPAREQSEEGSACFFPTTNWTTLLDPIGGRSPGAQTALNHLFEVYRKPIVSYLRTLVRDPHQSEDIAQDFIVRLLNRGDLESADRSKGRFRNYLKTSIRNYVIGRYHAEDAQKRRPTSGASSLDGLAIEPKHSNDAEKEFTRQWWRATIDEAMRRLRAQWEAAGKAELFDDLEPLLWDKKGESSIQEIAMKHAIAANAVSLRKMRLLERLRQLLLAVVGETIDSPGEIEEEIRSLLHDP